MIAENKFLSSLHEAEMILFINAKTRRNRS